MRSCSFLLLLRNLARSSVSWCLTVSAATLMWPVVCAAAPELVGDKALVATAADGVRTVIGSVRFAPKSDGETAFKVTLNREKFEDHFLSMREFKCLPGKTELSCHVPYPYSNPQTLKNNQLSWLEHSLLFFFNKPTDFGAKLWNGIYFEFQATPSGLIGTPKAIDLNLIAAPPDDTSIPPFDATLRHEIPSDSRWIRTLSIE